MTGKLGVNQEKSVSFQEGEITSEMAEGAMWLANYKSFKRVLLKSMIHEFVERLSTRDKFRNWV